MKPIRDALVRLVLFACVFIAWMWVLAQPFSPSVNLGVIVGCVLLVFPIVWFARLVLDRDPTPAHAEWITTLLHAVVMVLFGSAIIRAVTTYQAWRGWVIPIPGEVGLLLAIITGAAAALAVMNLAVRGLGAPFGAWPKIQTKLEAHSGKLSSLHAMESTGGEPDVVGYDKKTGEYIFYECSAESAKGRRSICYSRRKRAGRKRKERCSAGW